MLGYRSGDVDLKDALKYVQPNSTFIGEKNVRGNTETVNAVHMNLCVYIVNFIQQKKKNTYIFVHNSIF